MLLFGKLDQNSSKQTIQKTLKQHCEEISHVRNFSQIVITTRELIIFFPKNFGSAIAKCYSMAKLGGAASNTR